MVGPEGADVCHRACHYQRASPRLSQEFWHKEERTMQVGYARVSTPDQSLAMQLEALQQHGCTKIFPDSIGFSGRQRSLDCQRRLPLYFPCAPSSQLRHLSENNLNNIRSLKIYHLIRGNLDFSGGRQRDARGAPRPHRCVGVYGLAAAAVRKPTVRLIVRERLSQ